MAGEMKLDQAMNESVCNGGEVKGIDMTCSQGLEMPRNDASRSVKNQFPTLMQERKPLTIPGS
jgi:hypothetical protein